MKLLLAALFVIAMTVVGFTVDLYLFPNGPTWAIVPVMLLFFFGSIFASLILFNPGSQKKLSQEEQERRAAEFLEKLRSDDLLQTKSYRAKRAFGVEEFEDEGQHYFIELEDGGVLFIGGQYLYDYEPFGGRQRRFPCSEFTVNSHKKEFYVINIGCYGAVLEPEVTTPPLDYRFFEASPIFSEGEVIRSRTYEELKAEMLRTPRLTR